MSGLIAQLERFGGSGSAAIDPRTLAYGTYMPVEGIHAGLILPPASLTAATLAGTQTKAVPLNQRDVTGLSILPAASAGTVFNGSRFKGARPDDTKSQGVVQVKGYGGGVVATFNDCLIEPTPTYGSNMGVQLNGVHGCGYVCNRCVMRFGVDPVRVQGDGLGQAGYVELNGCVIEKAFSWHPDPAHTATNGFTHNDTIQMLEGSLKCTGCVINNLPWQTSGALVPLDGGGSPTATGGSPVIGGYQNPSVTISQLGGSSPGIGNITLDRNWIDGGGDAATGNASPAPSLQILDQPRTGFPLHPTFTITGNVWGQSGPLAKGVAATGSEVAFRIRGDLTGCRVIVTGNVWADGSAARYEVTNQKTGGVSYFGSANMDTTF